MEKTQQTDTSAMTVSRIENIASLVALALLVIGCFLVLRPFLSALIWAAILAFSTWPFYLWINEKVGYRKGLAAALISLLWVLMLLVPLGVLVGSFADEVASLIRSVPKVLESGIPAPPTWVITLPLIGETLHEYWSRWVIDSRNFFIDMRPYFSKYLPVVRGVLIEGGKILGQGIIEIALSLLLVFFFYRDGTVVVERIQSLLERLSGGRAQSLLAEAGSTVQRVVNGILGTALAQALLATIGFLLAGVPAALLLGFFTFFVSLIPMGPPLIWGPAVLWLFFSDQTGWAIFLAIWGVFVVSSVDNIIKPYLISRGGRLPLVIVLLGVFGGILTFGFIGIFLGPTLLAVTYVLVSEWLAYNKPNEAAEDENKPPAIR